MKELFAVIPLLLCGVVAEAPAPYPPSGFRPAGPAFELPQKNTQQQQQQVYLPPSQAQQPQPPSTSYGVPEEDVSVQGLPTLEQQPIFQVSPINGQEYVGPNFNSDIRNLDDSYRQAQYQSQQERYREFERQRQLEAAQARNRANPTPQVPRQFATESTISTTESTTRDADAFRTTESTTELDLNEGEILDEKKSNNKKEKVTVEVSKQKIQEYPGELFLSSLAQLQLQPQFVPFQLSQIRAPLYYQPIQQEASQKQVAGYDAQTHFAALPSVLAQQQYSQGIQGQGFQSPALLVARQQETANVGFAPQNPQPFINNQYQPIVAQVPQNFAQQPVVVKPDTTTQPKQEAEEDDEENTQQQPQFVYQQSYQPQEVIYQPPQPQQQDQQNVFLPQAQLVNYQNLVQQYQNSYPQQINQPQNSYAQPQLVNPQQYQNGYVQQQFVDQNQFQNGQQQAPQQVYQDPQQVQFVPQQVQIPQQIYQDQQFINAQQQSQFPQQVYQGQPQFVNAQQQVQIPQFQGQDSLQSGLDINQQGNGVDQNDKESDDDNTEDDESTSIAVATAFGARTQPRVFTRYGAPVPVPRQSADPQANGDADEKSNDDGSAVAEANAFATGRRKSAKLRSRRIRPLFTLDRSGHLVLAQEQN